MKKITTTFLLLALAMLLPMKTMAEDVTLTFLVPTEYSGKQLHVWLDDTDAAKDTPFWTWDKDPKVGEGDFATQVTYNNNSYYSITKTVANNNNLKNISAILRLETNKEVGPVEISDFSTVKYVIINQNSIDIVKTDDTPVVPIDTEHGTSSNGNAYYLVSVGHDTGNNSTGNIFAEENTQLEDANHQVHYNRILRLNDNGNGTYTIAIPTTITGKVYIEEIQKSGTSKFYGPSTNNYLIKDIASEASGELTSADTDDNAGGNSGINVWSIEDRGKEDGLYIITVFLGKDGNPVDWSFDYDASRRVAYFLSTAELSSANPIYDKRANNNSGRFNNTFESDIYFDDTNNINYYVISNIAVSSDYLGYAKNFDNTATENRNNGEDILPTVNKLLLLGNGGGNFENKDPYNEFSPNEKPMQTSDVLKGLCHVKYNPSNGNQNKLSGNHYGIRGQLEFNEGAKQNVSMAIVGPLFEKSMNKEDGSINYTYLASDGEPNNIMTYNDTDHYYELVVETTDEQNMKEFVFVANQSPSNIWYDYDRFARNPYYAAGPNTTSAATTQDPNKVRHGASGDINDATYKKINFNRPAGKWTIRFYIVNTIQGTQYYYTISSEENITVPVPVKTDKDGKTYVLRTFSYGADLCPDDKDVHIYAAQKFSESGKDSDTGTITGKVNLYEISYIPADEGVVLFYKNAEEAKDVTFRPANEYNTKDYPKCRSDKKLRWIYEKEEEYNNDLVQVLEDKPIEQSVYDESGETIIARNFGLNFFSNTNAASLKDKDSYTDYIGFFRLCGTVYANQAYLQYDNEEVKGNAQIFGQVTDGTQLEKDDNATVNSKLAIIFEGFNDYETTGIKDITAAGNKTVDGYYYNLQGIRVTNPAKGFYIHNGKKVIIK